MNSDEYEKMARVEARHWFYVGKRRIARWAIARFGARTQSRGRDRPMLLDVGAGSGRFAAEMADSHRVLVADDHAEALAMLRTRFAPEQVIVGAATALPLADGEADCITLLDVLEHVEDDRGAVAELHRVLKPGGLLVVTVPAMRQLWSDWDVALHHFRRYHRTDLAALFAAENWDRLYLNYINVAAFPAVWWLRRGRKPDDSTRSEEMIPPRPLNAVLRWLFVAPAKLPWLRAPFGVGLMIVLRKRTLM